MRTYSIAFASILCAILVTPVVAGAKDHGDGHEGKGEKHGNDEGRGNGGRTIERQIVVVPQQGLPHQQVVIIDRDRDTVSSYYREEFARGNCPPGLAKKDNGCMPPGLARKEWLVGQPLPPSATYYQLPPQLYSRLSPPPPGYEYVRVNDDVLLMQSANRSVVDLVVNLLR